MRITNFKSENLNDIINEIMYVYSKEMLFKNIKNIKDALSIVNVSFVFEGINRLQSTIICENNDSYVQQSQRYVKFDSESFYVPRISGVNNEFYVEGISLIKKSFDLYKEMTELKDPNKKGRLTKEDFKYGIPFEDARCIFPLAVTTNVTITMTGDKIIDLIETCAKFENFYNMQDIVKELSNHINSIFVEELFESFIKENKSINKKHKYYNEDIDKYYNLIRNTNMCECIQIGNGYETVAIGALASQNASSPVDIYNSWGDEQFPKSKKIITNVAGYGHMGILEHTRSTFVMGCSLSTYHQVIRHRLQKIKREDFSAIFNRERNDVRCIIPLSILKNNEYNKKVIDLIDEYTRFYKKYKISITPSARNVFLLNCHLIKFITTSNARNDNWIFRERLCLTAQDEIRELYERKFRYLYDRYPEIYKYGLPPCVLTGKCKEGKMTCGRIEEMKIKYQDIINQ